MERKVDVVVVGGGPAGTISASTARIYYPEKKIVLITENERGLIPCAIPYMLSSLREPSQNFTSYEPLKSKGIETVVDRVVEIDRKSKVVLTEKGDKYGYEKVILALGSKPIIPPIPGIEKKGVWPIKKNCQYLEQMVSDVRKSKSVLVVGGGFIGVEIADELSNIKGMKVSLVELLPRLLANSFDPEFSEMAQEKLQSSGVRLILNTKVEEFLGNGHVEKVRLSSGETVQADCVILGIGASPNTELALKAGLDLGKGKGIWVDEYMRTTDPDVFAVGDCAGKRDFFTRKDAPVMLASIATAEARIAGANLYKLKVLREVKGTIGIYSTYVGGLVLGSAGITETTATREGFEVRVGTAQVVDRHPATMPGASKNFVKLVFSRESEALLGGQVAGGISCGELINTIGIAIQKRISLTELETLQMATQPCLTAPPTMYPLVLAAQAAAQKD